MGGSRLRGRRDPPSDRPETDCSRTRQPRRRRRRHQWNRACTTLPSISVPQRDPACSKPSRPPMDHRPAIGVTSGPSGQKARPTPAVPTSFASARGNRASKRAMLRVACPLQDGVELSRFLSKTGGHAMPSTITLRMMYPLVMCAADLPSGPGQSSREAFRSDGYWSLALPCCRPGWSGGRLALRQ